MLVFSASQVEVYSRYANLKEVVLDELLAQHGDAQLYAQLHETACMSTLSKGTSQNQTAEKNFISQWIMKAEKQTKQQWSSLLMGAD